MEIANFVSVPEIKAKTAVLFPSRHYSPDESIPGNTVRAYLIKFAYTDEHFRVCQLVSECRNGPANGQSAIGLLLSPMVSDSMECGNPWPAIAIQSPAPRNRASQYTAR